LSPQGIRKIEVREIKEGIQTSERSVDLTNKSIFSTYEGEIDGDLNIFGL